MPRVTIGPAPPDRTAVDVEIARTRNLDIGDLRARWHTVFGRRPPPHLPRHLLFRVLAYRLQADLLGDLDAESQRLLDCSHSPEDAGQRAVELARRNMNLMPRTTMSREWNGHLEQVAVLADGFAWKGKPIPACRRLPTRSLAPAGMDPNSSVFDRNANVGSIAAREGCSVRKVNMTISLAFLAPDLVKAAIEGRLFHGMGVTRLCDLPSEWSRQHQMLGLTAA